MLLLLLIMIGILTACGYPQSEKAENQVPYEDQLNTVQNAVNQYKEVTQHSKNVQLNFEDIKHLLASNPLEREYKKRFTVKVGQHLKMISVDDIECFYSENKGTYVYTTNGRNYLLETTLEKLEEELAPEHFFRVSRKFYIHIKAIKDIISYTNSRLQIKLNSYTEQEVIVARERVKDFKLWLE